jgi:hypothetical protein
LIEERLERKGFVKRKRRRAEMCKASKQEIHPPTTKDRYVIVALGEVKLLSGRRYATEQAAIPSLKANR